MTKQTARNTSAISGISICEMRKMLNEIRAKSSCRRPGEPLLAMLLQCNPEYTVQEACYRIVHGHHVKRHKKSQKHKWQQSDDQ